MKYFAVSALLFICGCGGPTYPESKITSEFIRILKDEYKITDVKVKRNGNSIWAYVPVEKIFGGKEGLDEKAMDKVGNVSLTASRILLSSDAPVDFISVIASDKSGIELRMLRHMEDIKKVRVWYISYTDFYHRSDIGIGLDPEITGIKMVKQLCYSVNKGESAGSYINSENAEDVKKKIPKVFGKISEIKSVRIGEDKALVYIKTADPDQDSLFLIDVEFSDLLKSLLILYLNKKEEADAESDEENKGLSFPVIADCWNISEGAWPEEYSDYKETNKWRYKIYTSPVDFNEFIADQIERKVKLKFKEKKELWKIEINDIEAAYFDDIIQVTRDIETGRKPVYDADADHEIALIVSRAVKNYNLPVERVVIHTPLWKITGEYERNELLELKPRRYRLLVKTGPSLADTILMFFVPGYGQQPAKNVSEKKQDEEERKSDYDYLFY